MQDFDEATIAFEDEIRRLKKEKASLHQATKHKRLGKSNMRFASDLMSRSEKIKHKRAGKIMTSNIYDKIPLIEEFEKLEKHERRNWMAYLRNTYTNKEIMNGMKLSNKAYYDIVAELELPKAPRTNKGERKPRKVSAIKVLQATEQLEFAPEIVRQEEPPKPAPLQEIVVNGLHLVFNGTYQPEHIIKQFLKFGAMLEGETDDYYVELKLVQKAPI